MKKVKGSKRMRVMHKTPKFLRQSPARLTVPDYFTSEAEYIRRNGY
jgi:hypothetical protein